MKIVCLLSGGLDSSTLLFDLRRDGHVVFPLCVTYGQRHWREIDYARKIASSLGLSLTVVNLDSIRAILEGSSQTDSRIPVPEGHYEDETMRATVVPNRNMLLLAAAGAFAVSKEAQAIAYAAHEGDHAIYPDCRPEFIKAMEAAFRLCAYEEIKLLAPFSSMSKANIVQHGSELGVPFYLTYSCYKGGVKHCGKCGTCFERREAFERAAVEDPTEYEQ